MPAPTEEQMRAGFQRATESLEGSKPKPSPKSDETPKPNGGAQQLRSIVDRIVRLEEEKAGISDDIKDIYTEAASAGWTKKAVRIVVKRETEDAEARASREAVEMEAEQMIVALGCLSSTPLGEAAVGRAKH